MINNNNQHYSYEELKHWANTNLKLCTIGTIVTDNIADMREDYTTKEINDSYYFIIDNRLYINKAFQKKQKPKTLF